MNNLISIIVPIYNAEKYLKECITSILAQTHENIQLILVNDGSTDNSLIICNHYKSLDSRVVVIDKLNEGVSATRSLGISIAEGDYIGFVDSDDYIQEDMYEVLLKQIQNDKSQVCAMSTYTIIDNIKKNQNDIRSGLISSDEALKNFLLLRFPTSLWAYLYSNEVVKNCMLNSDIHFFEDFEFNFRVLTSIEKLSICSGNLYNYRTNESSTNRQMINDKRITCLKIYELVMNDIKKKGSEFIEYALFFRTHFLVSVILSISKSVNVDYKFYDIANKHAKEMLFKSLISKFVPNKYKIIILLYSLSPVLTGKLLYMFKYKQII